MKKFVLFGRSPFVNDVDREKIIEKNYTVGLNNFCAKNAVDMNFCFAKYVKPISAKTVVFCHFEKEAEQAVFYRPVPSRKPLLDPEFENGILKLACCCFVGSLAINWAILMKKEAVYLVGIDHVEDNKEFVHNDGVDDEFGHNMNAEIHQEFKKYVYECAKHIKIYQCNPSVKQEWKLPFVEIEELYA